MRKNSKAVGIRKLLKQGYTVYEIKNRMAVSGSYIHEIKKQMLAGVEAEVEKPAKTTTLSVDKTVYPEAGEFVQADTNVDAILNTRATTYGSFADVARMAQRLKSVAHTVAGGQGKTFAADQAEALDMIFSKLARILNGNPNHVDSWVDIAGYAQLVADRLQGKVR